MGMSLYHLTEEQLEKMQPYLPKSHGISRICDRKILSGIIHVLKSGLLWRDAPQEYGSHKTLYNRYYRWSRNGTFKRIEQLVHYKKNDEPREIGRTRGGFNSKLHAVCNSEGKPIAFYLTAGQVSDYKGAKENLFAKIKDWRRIATCYDRCAHTFFSAICIASTVTFFLN